MMNEMPISGPGFLKLIAKKRAKGPHSQSTRKTGRKVPAGRTQSSVNKRSKLPFS